MPLSNGVLWMSVLGSALAAAPAWAQSSDASDTGVYAIDGGKDAALCPVCGYGPIVYYDFTCTRFGWEMSVVGYQDFGACGPLGPLVGRRTECVQSLRDVAGGGDDVGQCWYVDCEPPKDGDCPAFPTIDVPPDEVAVFPAKQPAAYVDGEIDRAKLDRVE